MSTSQERKLAELMVTALKNAEVPRFQAAVNKKKRRKYTKKEDAFLKKNAKIHILIIENVNLKKSLQVLLNM